MELEHGEHTGSDATIDRSSENWSARANCVGHAELFFPPFAERPQTRLKREAKAKLLCAKCPVVAECRSFAHENREYGIWGGENEEERIVAGVALHAPIGARHLSRPRPVERVAS